MTVFICPGPRQHFCFLTRPKTHMRSAVLCQLLNNSVWFRFDSNVQHYFVSIRETFIDIFVASTELRKIIIAHIVPQKNTKNCIFAWKTDTKLSLHKKKQRKILLARVLSIRQLPTLGCWDVTPLLLWFLLQKKYEYHRICCEYLAVAACQDCRAWNERKKPPTFLPTGRKYGLWFVEKWCTHVQVLGVVAMVKNEWQGCNVSYRWKHLFLSSVELEISIDM